MINLLDINARVEVSLKNDKTEPKTIFILRPLTGPERLDLTRFFKVEMGPDNKPQASLLINGEYAKLVLTKAITEVKDGDKIKTIPDIIDRLGPDDILELITKVGELSSLTETEVKN